VARTPDPRVDEAIAAATVRLLGEKGFGQMTVEEVAALAAVGKPAIYRRYANKAELVEAVIRAQPAEPEVPDLGDTKAELWEAVRRGLPVDSAGYLRLVAGLVAVESSHPQLIAALRESLLAPRRAVVVRLLERGVERGDLRPGGAPGAALAALDQVAGAYLARALAGLGTGSAWRRRQFELWWEEIAAPRRRGEPR
jgi:AcrR family transcriptional regulator